VVASNLDYGWVRSWYEVCGGGGLETELENVLYSAGGRVLKGEVRGGEGLKVRIGVRV
jgi:hypothetical protein